jgi:Uma2 family endonuclease
MAIAPPHDRMWTADDLEGLPDNARYEVLEGTLLVSPLEREMNLDAAIDLRRQLDRQLPAGWIAEREVGIRVGTDGLVPDVAVLRRRRDVPRHNVGVEPADIALVVEVVSPTSRRRDRLLKPEIYAEASIVAFWRVELEPQPRLLAYELAAGAYVLVADLNSTGTVELLGVTVELDVAALV